MFSFSKKTMYQVQLTYTPEEFAELLNDKNEKKLVNEVIDDLNHIENLNTKGWYLTKFRKAARKRLGTYPKELKLNPKIWKDKEHERKVNLNTKLKDVHVIDDPQILIKTAMEYIQTNLPYKIATGLALLTGRRSIEVTKIGKLKDKSDCNEMELYFEGQAKAKREVKAYKIPILGDKKIILERWKVLRKLKPEWQKEENIILTSKINGVLNRYARTIWDKINTFKDLRAIYSSIAYHYFARNSNIAAVKYVAEILGHVCFDDTSPVHYMKYKVRT
jgi:hypothetical protein